MPEYIVISDKWGWNGPGRFRFGMDETHVRRILAGLRGRWPDASVTVVMLTDFVDVTADFNA